MTDRRAAALVGGVLLGLLGVLAAPSLHWLWLSWQAHPFYAHGPLVPVVAAWFAWRARARLVGGGGSDAGLLVIAAGAASYVLALRAGLQLPAIGGLLVAASGIALFVGGRAGLTAAAFPLALLALAVPLPLVERLAPDMAASVAHAAAVSASAAGAVVERAGAQLVVGGGAFTVGAPCSGLRSLIALVTLATMLAGLADGPRGRRTALVGAAIPLALGANWARLTGLIVASDALGPERGLALFHATASPLSFAAATAALVVFGHVLGCHVRADD